MAKNAGRLAGLAALAGAAYMMSKDKDKGTTDSNPTRGSGRDSTETRLKTPAQSIAESDKSDKSSSISTKGESGTTTPGPDKSAPDLSESRNKPASQRSTPSKPASASAPSLAPENRNLEAGMSRGTRAAPAAPTASTVSSTEEGMANYKPRRTPTAPVSTVSSSEEGMKNYVPRKPIYRQETQQERAERYVAKRRAAQDAGMKKGGMTSTASSASKRADGIASKGKTKCKMY